MDEWVGGAYSRSLIAKAKPTSTLCASSHSIMSMCSVEDHIWGSL